MPVENFAGVMLCPIVQVIDKNVKHCYALQGIYHSFLVCLTSTPNCPHTICHIEKKEKKNWQ